jgi:hypothetical protein
VERERTTNPDGTATHRYVQADVHDFAWTTSPELLDVRRRFEDVGPTPIDVRLLLQPEHADQIDRHIAAVRATLASYARWVGPYPYAQLTVVDPVTIANARVQGNGTGGMEYPTLITAGAGLHPGKGPIPKRSRSTKPATSSGTASSRPTSSNTRGSTRV